MRNLVVLIIIIAFAWFILKMTGFADQKKFEFGKASFNRQSAAENLK
ncbi:hypothetical protein ACFL0T_07870 [Candidatus Omnitrophota bacterium]